MRLGVYFATCYGHDDLARECLNTQHITRHFLLSASCASLASDCSEVSERACLASDWCWRGSRDHTNEQKGLTFALGGARGMSSAGDRHGHSRAESEWQQALELEKKLKATYRKKSFYDPEARALRAQLRGCYESLLYLDAAFATANDVEVALWRAVFYRPIEEFRSRMKQAEKAGEVGAAQLPKVAAAFTKFLEEASLFYRRLVMQLQAVYGDVGIKVDVPKQTSVSGANGGIAAAGAMHSSASSSAPRDVRSSIHRCLIYLGDLSRYTAQAAPKAVAAAAAAAPSAPQQQPAARQDWHKAAHYYRLAARVLPRSGNPHNQLAVMAVMMGDELRAVYHYARSLCVGTPFQTAKENLMLLFEQNRHRYTEYVQQKQQQQQQQHQQQLVRQLPPAHLLAEVSVCYVRVSGLFFDKINQHEYSDVSENAVAALAALTGHQALMDLMQRQPRADCTPLHLTVLGIFAVHNCNPASAEGRTLAAAVATAVAHGDAAQRSKQRSRALTMMFKTGRLLCQAASAACNAVAAAAAAAPSLSGTGHATSAAGPEWKAVACLLVAVNVFFHWLAAHPSSSGIQVNAATEDEVKARATFWSAAAQVVAAAVEAYPYNRTTAVAAVGSQSSLTSSGGVHQGSDGNDPCDGGALPEELELLGFEPLRSNHYSHVTDVGKLAVDEPATRTCRMLAAARAISAHISAAEQEQAMKQYSSASSGQVQVQTIKQLAAGVQQFVTAVAGRQPAVAAAAGGGNADTQVEAMDVDAQSHHQQQQQQHLPDVQQHGMDCEIEEEVIVFRPRISRISTLSDDSGTVMASAAAASSPSQVPVRASPPKTLPVRVPPSVAAAAAAVPPPFPQQLLASRQQGRASGSSSQVASGATSPAGTASPQRPAATAAVLLQQQHHVPQQQQQNSQSYQQHQDAGVQPMLTDVVGRSAAEASPSLPAVTTVAGMGGSGSNLAAAGLLHGHAATALDLQQGQAASDALLARLTSRQVGSGSSKSGLGSSGLGVAAGGSGLGLGLSSNLPPAPGYGGMSAGISGSFAAPAASGGINRGAVSSSLNLAGNRDPVVGPTTAIASHSGGFRSQPPSPAVFGSTAAALTAAGGYLDSPRVGFGIVPGQQQHFDQQFVNPPSGAFTAPAVQHSRGSSVDTLGLGLGLQGLGQQAAGDGFEGFDPLGPGLNSALNSQVFAGGGAEGLSTAAGGVPFDDQLLLDIGSGFRTDVFGGSSLPPSQQQRKHHQQQQQQYADRNAAYQLEQTARAAADCILSPEHKEGSLLMQQHQQQQTLQQQQFQAAVTAQQALAEAAAAASAADVVAARALAIATGLQGERSLSRLQQQQQRRCSDGHYSPSFQQAVGFGRSSFRQQQEQSMLGRVSAPATALPGGSMDLTAASATAARTVAVNSVPSSPSVLAAAAASGGYAMFAGRDLFASADVPVLSAAAVQERQQRISSSNVSGSDQQPGTFSGNGDVLLPPLDGGQSQNPFAS